MTDSNDQYASRHRDYGADANLVNLAEHRRREMPELVTFHRRDLDLILRLYGRMVAEGEWRDYAIDHLKDRAVFSVYRRTSEVPLYQIEKDPSRARKQGAYAVVSGTGAVLKRGHELVQVLKVFDKPRRIV